jgi:hypothetical protein
MILKIMDNSMMVLNADDLAPTEAHMKIIKKGRCIHCCEKYNSNKRITYTITQNKKLLWWHRKTPSDTVNICKPLTFDKKNYMRGYKRKPKGYG